LATLVPIFMLHPAHLRDSLICNKDHAELCFLNPKFQKVN